MSSQERGLLRKMEFPDMARDALPIIENLINRNKHDQAMDLIGEFVFRERRDEQRGSGQFGKVNTNLPRLSSIEEFQLVLVLCEFFSRPGPDATRNAVFLSLFGGSVIRTSVLNKLISTAVSGSIAPLLCAAGTWMQQLGCTSPASLELAQCIVRDFVIFSKKSSEQLKSLPLVAPRFAANLMTAVTDLYLNGSAKTLDSPPDLLLDVITEWVSENPSLCLASQQQLALPSGAIAMPVTTPLAGLIRWCVLSLLVTDKQELYSKLHLAVLQSLLDATPPVTTPPTLQPINAQHLMLIVNSLQTEMDNHLKSGKSLDEENLQSCLERFAQAVQVGLTSRCIFGNITQLIFRLESLPGKNKLLQIVINANKSSL
ncbi:integrator complex subunit 15 [Anopheles ziemanni]|uniref:integrator complex subunit 15 n=1 Tax=Anopheles coustani TaxID=139045 RepID=UPI0026595678|nr:integrator complex subunit 15 [Anopheles coustani]XP_058130258.1 integrator complex subunit 15 [Anopheles coustani]XP_058171616.1 integrator complex subunit 15 [Anopheles ziemanni]